MNINRVTLLGRLTRDPEVRKTPNGKAVANFGLATNRHWREGEEWKSSVVFHNIVVWQGLTDKVSFFAKGDLVFVEGRIQNRVWEDDKGVKHHRSDVIADRLMSVGGSAPEVPEKRLEKVSTT